MDFYLHSKAYIYTFNDGTMRKKALRLSLFEKVILVNSILLVSEALAGLWITSHSLETHHYLIDTSFIVIATLLILLTNTLLLRASFRPLYTLLATIREISRGKTDARAKLVNSNSEVGELAQAFNSMLDTLEGMRREQAMLILQAQEEEQRRIALELHDEAGQNLTALLVHTELLHQRIQAFPPHAMDKQAQKQLQRGLTQINTLTQLTLEGIRVLAQQLRPSVLDDLGLVAAFRWLTEDSRQRLHLPVHLTLSGIEETQQKKHIPSAHEIALFRIAQEGLTNVARHAQAQHVLLSLRKEEGKITVCVQDDGVGYDPETARRGLGVFGMQERAALLGGTLTIRSRPGEGTVVEGSLPLSPTHQEVCADVN